MKLLPLLIILLLAGCSTCPCVQKLKPKPEPLTQVQMNCTNCLRAVWVIPLIVTNEIIKLPGGRTQYNRTISARCLLEPRGYTLRDHRTLLIATDKQLNKL